MEGERLGPYLIERELGAGGMGRVFAARTERTTGGLGAGTVVAIKLVHPHLLETEGFFKRFMREARIGASITHENVVRTLDCDALGGRHFLVMEYVEGRTLAALIDDLGAVPEQLCRHIGREICRALVAIHAEGAVHRDLKPENVIIARSAATRDGDIADDVNVKVMDLGVARLVDESVRLSQTGAFVGSIEYASPEQFDGAADHRSDLHGLGILLYELASEQHPFRTDDFRAVIKRICHDEPRRLGAVRPQVSAFFEEVVHTLLAKSPGERFADAAELLAVLEDGEDSAWWRERAHALQASSRAPLRRIRIPRDTAVYGRDEELAALDAALERAAAGDGQVLLLTGEAGIGKSRLVDEFVARRTAGGSDLHFLFGSYPPGGAATADGAFSTAYREQFGERGSADYLSSTPILVPAFDALLQGSTAPKDAEPLTKQSIQTCFVNATRALAEEHVTIVLIDDLHFAPDEGRALFTALATAVAGHRVLLIGTARPGLPGEWTANLVRLPHAGQVGLSRLGPKDLARLLADSFRSEALAHALGVQVGLKSDGNPFFAFEIIRGLREGQFITQREDGTWMSTQAIREIEIPSSVLDLVNARVADLSTDERNLLDAAACCGFEFDPGLVGSALGMRRIVALQAFGTIEKKHRLVRSSGRLCVFDHHQVQEALYGGLNEQLREEYHAAIGAELERTSGADARPVEDVDGALAVELVEHFFSGARRAQAARYLDAAVTHLEDAYLPAQAASLLGRALAYDGMLHGQERAGALARAGVAYDRIGDRDAEEAIVAELTELAETLDDDEWRCTAARHLGTLRLHTGRYDESVAANARALDIARAARNEKEQLSALSGLANAHLLRHDYDDAQRLHTETLMLARRLGSRRYECNALVGLGNTLIERRRPAESVPYYREALQYSREEGNRLLEAVCVGNLGAACLGMRAFDEMIVHTKEALSLARTIGNRRSECRAHLNMMDGYRATGHYADAETHADLAITMAREVRDPAYEAHGMTTLGAILELQGRLDEAADCARTVRASAEARGGQRRGYVAVHNLGSIARNAGDLDTAETHLRACLEIANEVNDRFAVAVTHVLLGQIDEERGDRASACAKYRAALSTSREARIADIEISARAYLAAIGDLDDDAVAQLISDADERRPSFSLEILREVEFQLYRATRERRFLESAKAGLDETRAHVRPRHHESFDTHVRLHRDILEAWRAEFGDGAAESATRPG